MKLDIQITMLAIRCSLIVAFATTIAANPDGYLSFVKYYILQPFQNCNICLKKKSLVFQFLEQGLIVLLGYLWKAVVSVKRVLAFIS